MVGVHVAVVVRLAGTTAVNKYGANNAKVISLFLTGPYQPSEWGCTTTGFYTNVQV